MAILLPHHDGSALYAPQSVTLGGTAQVRVRIPLAWGTATRVWVRSVQDGEPRYDAATNLGERDGWVWWEAATRTTNPVARYRFLLEAGGKYWNLNAQGLFSRDVSDHADFRLTAFDPAPEWLHRAVMYQIFPDRFARSVQVPGRPVPDWAVACTWHTPVIPSGPETSVQLYGGDLHGITERLDHLQRLGINLIYLTPFFPATSNHRYDAATFDAVDPLLGGDQALADLVEAAHSRGMRVIGDLTANHSGDAHEWFAKAAADPGSEEAGYYYFSTDHSHYESWWGVPSLPKFNWSSAQLRERFVLAEDSVVARWLRPPFSLDGWRIDVGNMTGRLGAVDLHHEVARLIADRIREINPDAALLAESTSDASPDLTGEHWQGAMTYSNLTRPLWSWLAGSAPDVNFFGSPLAGPNRIGAEDFLATHQDLASTFSWQVRRHNMNALNTHDTARAATVMIDGGPELAAVLVFTLPGIPMVFAGDEFGLQGMNGEDSRTPMPWDEPQRVLKDLAGHYAALAGLRRHHDALTEGGVRWLHAEGDALVFIRETAHESVLVFVARAAVTVALDDAALSRGQFQALAAGPAFHTGTCPPTLEGGSGAGSEAGINARLVAHGPVAGVWVLPGTAVPEA
ncbi:glycoside hydrolase family 13 protein [Pseudarthrobacter sp. J64]|uniref:glycoside hydrolase family 13 protein n=1 Tax=Pseudarthrobacter sp. J64 TaxID=3116485 RepID=UPI002E807128|nr:glycoside hydrolase family 13 protein [Pseudarthrobacter sp. J64]MEE2568769.1 glycoside hydrolase family 13 protein [Pseudarthrobacter sp. J64]